MFRYSPPEERGLSLGLNVAHTLIPIFVIGCGYLQLHTHGVLYVLSTASFISSLEQVSRRPGVDADMLLV